jgi:DNA (cytosine-5)-methyltransferase 1
MKEYALSGSGLTYGSVCSGIESASVAWEPIGWRAIWLAEIEPFPSSVLKHRYPDVPNLGDMTKIADRILSGEIEAPDVLVGGTPCQAFSVAGMRAGLEDDRGQLTLRFMELANAIDKVRIAAGKRPCIIVWENVPGVLSDKTNAFGCLLGGLAGEDDQLVPSGSKWSNAGAVYGPQRAIAWRILDAQYFRVAQRRRRVFVVASAGDGFDPAEILFERDGVRRDSAPSRELGKGFTVDVVPCLTGGGWGISRTGENRGQDPVVGCWWDGGQVSQTLDAVLCKRQCMPEKNRFPAVLVPLSCEPRYFMRENKTGGKPSETAQLSATNAATAGDAAPCVAYGFQPRIARNGRGDMGDVVCALTSEAGNTGKGDAAPCVAIVGEPHPIQNALRGKSQNGVGVGDVSDPMYTLDIASQHGIAYAIQAGATRVNPASGPDGVGVQPDISYTIEARAEVQAVAFSCKDHGGDALTDIAPTLRAMASRQSNPNAGGQLAVCVSGDVAHTLKAEGFDASEDGTGRGQPVVAFAQNTRDEVREMPYAGALSAQPGAKQTTYLRQAMAVRRITPRECERLQGFPDDWTLVPHRGKPAADGPRYKALGNAMAVPCMRWIGLRIRAYLNNTLRAPD